MMSDEILLSVADGIATVTLNRPEKRNALSWAMLDELVRTFDRLEHDRAVRVVVVQGEGMGFCSGLDLREMGSLRDGDDLDTFATGVFQQIERSRHPTIARVHGDALAGGCELALHCDLRVVSETARFGMPLARLGLVAPFALGQKLVEVAGPAFAKQMLFTGQPVTARRAYEIGMIHQLTAPEQLDAATATLAGTIAANAPLSLAGMKAAVHRAIAYRDTIDHRDIDELIARARVSADAREGIQAMLEKRQPVFRGE